jgi:hypothetical protein
MAFEPPSIVVWQVVQVIPVTPTRNASMGNEDDAYVLFSINCEAIITNKLVKNRFSIVVLSIMGVSLKVYIEVNDKRILLMQAESRKK